MPVHNKKFHFEAAEDFNPDIVCSSEPHGSRLNPSQKKKSTPSKTEEKKQDNKEIKAK